MVVLLAAEALASALASALAGAGAGAIPVGAGAGVLVGAGAAGGVLDGAILVGAGDIHIMVMPEHLTAEADVVITEPEPTPLHTIRPEVDRIPV